HWTGEDLAGRTILLHAEGGFGDTLQLVRYVPLVRQRGGRVIVECQREVKSLIADIAGEGETFVRDAEPLPALDVQCYFGSLPWIFNANPATIPAQIPYLKVDSQRVA